MSEITLREEMNRAWAAMMGGRGGKTPLPMGDLLAVVMLDDDSAFPPYRRWAVGNAKAAVAGEFSMVGVMNVDPKDARSTVTVDWFAFLSGAASSALIGPSREDITLASFTDAHDIAPESGGGAASGIVRISNVRCGTTSNVAPLSTGVTWPDNVTTLRHSPTGWRPAVLGPQRQFIIALETVNVTLSCMFGGRYYSPR